MPNKIQIIMVALAALTFSGCLDPETVTIRPEHQDARVPSDLCRDVVCPLSEDPCTEDGVCDPGTGECVFAQRQDGDFCDDSNQCTQGDRCLAGVCVGGSPVVCQPISQCHEAGSCDPESGCSTPLKDVGTSCGDGDACTIDDQCNADGVCVGAPKACEALDGCHEAGVCNSATGECTNPNSADGKQCAGPDADDLCLTGACLDATCVLIPVVCDERPCQAGTCNSGTGTCEYADLDDGLDCDDSNACTVGTTCSAGQCDGGSPLTCEYVEDTDDCIQGIECDPSLGCVTRQQANGTDCDDGNLCTFNDQCANGVCSAEPVSCFPPTAGSCDAEGQCNPNTGACDYGFKPDGARCAEDLCQVGQTCMAGQCQPGNLRACPPAAECKTFDRCDPREGCLYEILQEGDLCYLSGQGPECDPTADPCPNSAECVERTDNDGASIFRCQLLCPDSMICAEDTDENGDGQHRCKAPCRDNEGPCTIRDACEVTAVDGEATVECVGVIQPCNTPPNDQCYAADSGICDREIGQCRYETIANGLACEDGDSCTLSDVCTDGACLAGAAKQCTSTQCYTETCNGTVAAQENNCERTILAGALCSSSDFCVARALCTAEGSCEAATANACDIDPEQYPTTCFELEGSCQEVSDDCYFFTRDRACDSGEVCGVRFANSDLSDLGQSRRTITASPQEQSPIALIDIDSDGRVDVLMGGLSGVGFLYNDSADGGEINLSFSHDRAVQNNQILGTSDIANVQALLVGDLDGDSDTDLIVLTYGDADEDTLFFFKNNGGRFIAGNFVATDTPFPTGGVLADFDNDGDLDVYVASYNGRNNLYENQLNTDNRFVLRQNWNNEGSFKKTTAVALMDLGTDGYPDVITCNETSQRNQGSVELLAHQGEAAAINADSQNQVLLGVSNTFGSSARKSYCKGVSVADYDRDGDSDFLITRPRENQLFEARNNQYTDFASGRQIMARETFPFCPQIETRNNATFHKDDLVSWSSAWGDWNADGMLDAYVTRGTSVIPGGQEANYLLDGLYVAKSNNQFEDMVASGYIEADTRSSRGVAIADLNRDGDLDIIVNHLVGYPKVIENQTDQGNSLTFTVSGRTINRDGIGTKVTASYQTEGNETAQQRVLVGANHNGVAGTTPVNHIGVGAAPTVNLEVIWQLPKPIGAQITQRLFDVPANLPTGQLLQPYKLVEPGSEIVDLEVEWGPDRFDDVPFSAGNADELLANGVACQADAECESTDCDMTLANPVCVALPTCDDAELNGRETSQDCGGPDCPRCVDGRTCSTGEDCESRICSGDPEARCQVPTCSDAAINGGETDLNCGGPCPDACATGKICQEADDCVEGVCTNNLCVDAECDDGVQNGHETALNCGGNCPGCETGQACVTFTDCRHLNCVNDICAAPTCSDRIKNGEERAVDCGGPDCGTTCDDGTSCNVASDCTSGVCSGTPFTCQEPTCEDGVLNGDYETDIDCGGLCSDKCDAGEDCSVDSDCSSNKCYEDLCRRQNSRSVNVQFTVKRFENHSGQAVECSVRLNDEAANVVPIGMASYTNGVHFADITTNVIVNDPNATSANIVVECVLKSNGNTVDGTQTQAKANLGN